MRIVFAGTPEVAIPSLDALVAAGHDVAAVVTRPDAPAGRGRRLAPSPVAARAAELGIDVLKPVSARGPELVDALTAIAPDCCPVVAYGNLVPQVVLDVPVHGWVNLHFSLLPAWRGAAPVQRAIIAGDDVLGASTFELVQALDAGPVYRTLELPTPPRITSGEALDLLAREGAQLLVDTLADIAAGARPTAQPDEGLSLAPKLTVEEARLDLTGPAEGIDRLVRGCNPAPGAWTTFRGERFKVLLATPDEAAEPLAPGELRATKRTLHVGTGTVPLLLESVQPVGKKPMSGADFARGITLEAGEVLA